MNRPRIHWPSATHIAWVSFGLAVLALGFGLSAFSVALVLLTGEVNNGQ